jgi:hypothetical protein
MGIFAHAIGIFPQSLRNIPYSILKTCAAVLQLFGFDLDIDGFIPGGFCEQEFEDAVLAMFPNSRRQIA